MKKLIKFYKRLTFLQGTAFAIALTSVIAIATTVGPMTTFAPNTTISSTEVNDNFEALKFAIESSTGALTYQGTWDATGALPTGASNGDYYIVTVADGAYAVGDWIIWNGSAFDIQPPSGVTSIFARSGAVVAMEGDYNLDKLADVDLTTPSPVVGNFLKFDGTNWKAASITASETDPSVSAFAKAGLPTCSAGEVLKSNGTSFSCVVDNAGAAAFSGTNNTVVVTDGAGVLSSSTTSSTELSYLTGVTSAIQTQLNAKQSTITAGTTTEFFRGDKTWQTLNTTAVPEGVNLYFTEPRVKNTVLTGFAPSGATILSTDTLIDALGKAQGQLNAKLGLSGGVVSVGTISGIPTPTNADDVTNKGYVDSFGQWSRSGGDIHFPSGNVGIGITPTAKLHVNGNSVFQGTLEASSIATPLGSSSTPVIKNTGSSGTGIFWPTSNEIGFSANFSEAMRITNSGFVGIGLTTPAEKLSVAGNTVSNIFKVQGFGSASAAQYARISDAGTGLFFPLVGEMGVTTGGIERVRFTSAGKVGIGTTNPTDELSIVGNASLTGNVTAVAYNYVSDRRYKKNITTVTNSLEKILGLRGVEFDWKNNGNHDIGVIAQEVEKVVPALVTTNPEGMKSVKYANMIGLFIESTKEMNAKVTTLEKENKMLKNYLCTRDPMAPFCEE